MELKMRCISVVILTIVVASGSLAQARRSMTIDDLIGAIRVGEPDLSPDGKEVLFTRTTTAIDTGRRNTDIWTVPADASRSPRQLIGGEKTETTPRFTPDGKRIVFISNRDGAPQVYIANLEGQGIRQITKLSAGGQPPLVVSP